METTPQRGKINSMGHRPIGDVIFQKYTDIEQQEMTQFREYFLNR